MTYSSADDFYLEGYEKGVAEGLERGRSEAMQARLIAIEECAKIAEPWSGFLTGDKMGAMDRAIVDVRQEVADAIRALSSPLSSKDAQ